MVNVFMQWKHVWRQGGLHEAIAFCDKYALVHKNLTVMNDTRSQLVELVKVDHRHCNRYNKYLDMIHVALLAASFPNVIQSEPDSIRYYSSPRGTVLLHSRSIFASDEHQSAMASSLQMRFDAARVAASAPVGESSALPAQIRVPPTVTTSRTLSSFFAYMTCMMQSDRIIVFDATNVHPLLFVFCVGCITPLNVDYVVQTVSMDAAGMVKFRVPPKTLALLRAFHGQLVCVFQVLEMLRQD
ncbi:hypothetical protein BCR44DRAFT_46454 [Catenaria anguillulae PL171]|uniref:Uncharacterized protein n=1 Tax=Catenaria anguillulae PL171 TaxID=765915 RepID=A0A1Y2HII0_9FUNG|nr:hypothetical protein BCR44DRAFT_46454 [Catenaria anguillulae PL171]